ncbi:unnamed protein product [Penicillium roqueforti FM164]|uniref:Genomic scaffold, ProqFM164S02 n=1 Tax=Penicillium roqueforti (strain FM164) TaxID=1365484 RepID=W6QEJ9_PENRF|nr:unnamed protein product [Penicillium roqueforti FM164]
MCRAGILFGQLERPGALGPVTSMLTMAVVVWRSWPCPLKMDSSFDSLTTW